jgi:nucleotide-binding universal stress UspA family protein
VHELDPMQERPFRILVDDDFTPEADIALSAAAQAAGERSAAELHLLNVRPYWAPRREGIDGELCARARAALDAAAVAVPVVLYGHVFQGIVARTILEFAAALGPDLIVVGSKGRKRLFLPSAADVVARKADCPVLVARDRSAEPDPHLVPEPPCEACLRVRELSDGAETWCAIHDRPWLRPHRYHYHGNLIHPYHADRWSSESR